jgi:hypothetical protein
MKFLDRKDPFFRHAWVRYLTVAVPTGMGLLEFYFLSPGWGILFLASGAYAFWELILRTGD